MMNFGVATSRVVEQVDRRVLGAFRLVDAVTQLPIVFPAQIEIREAALVGAGDPVDVALAERSAQLQQNTSGFYAITRAPFFDDYAASFDDPADPPETAAGTQLRLLIAVIDAGPSYLPQEFFLDLPRSLNRTEPGSIFEPTEVQLFRSPGAPVLGGWSVLRVSATRSGTGAPLPGVLVRIFKNPRGAADAPIGWGMSEWRGHLAGEALVAIADLPRFRPGNGVNVFETTQEIHFETTRDPAFTAAPDELPELAKLVAASAPGILRQRSDAAAAPLIASPSTPLALRAGEEKAVRLTIL